MASGRWEEFRVVLSAGFGGVLGGWVLRAGFHGGEMEIMRKRYEKQPEDVVQFYGPNIPVLERDGHIVAVMGEDGWEEPMMHQSLRLPSLHDSV